MSHLRQQFGNSMLRATNMAARSRDASGNWLRRLGASATTMEAKDSHGQLQSILDYYNKPHQSKTGEVDWDSYRSRIHTPDVVDKIQAKYEKFMESNYSVDGAVARCGNSTEKMQALDVAMQWNYTLYLAHYTAHLSQLETMRNAGDITTMSNYEVAQLCPGAMMSAEMASEIGNMAPPDAVEDNMATRLCTQFSWGSRYCPPFWHSSENTSCVAATLGKFGN